MLTDVAVTPSQYYLLHGKTADGRMQLLEDGMVGGAGHTTTLGTDQRPELKTRSADAHSIPGPCSCADSGECSLLRLPVDK